MVPLVFAIVASVLLSVRGWLDPRDRGAVSRTLLDLSEIPSIEDRIGHKSTGNCRGLGPSILIPDPPACADSASGVAAGVAASPRAFHVRDWPRHGPTACSGRAY
ncbi:hypothetical protein KM043_004077 [Ampulex compressa]|nr:hypothetical protein KM043_004077 [Ampulex compressa]